MVEPPAERQDELTALDEVVVDATRGLFGAYGLDICGNRFAQSGWRGPDGSSASVVGFTSPDFSGSLVIGTTLDIVRETSPEASSLHDWMGELANQLLGRIKNRLLRYGVALDMAIPVVIMGIELRTPVVEGRHVLDYGFDSKLGKIVVRVDLTPTWRLHPPCDGEDTTTAEEGELLLF